MQPIIKFSSPGVGSVNESFIGDPVTSGNGLPKKKAVIIEEREKDEV